MFTLLKDIDRETLNSIQWEMTPEDAIALHLEWGPLRSQAYYNSRDKDNETTYFVVDTWRIKPHLCLVRRKGFDSEILGEFQLPRRLQEYYGSLKGIFTPGKETIVWIKDQIK